VISISQTTEKDLNGTASAVGGMLGQTAVDAGGRLARKAGQAAMKQAGKGLMSLGRMLISFLGPYLWIAIVILIVFLLVFSLTLGVFGAMTAGDSKTGLFTGVNESPADPLIQAAYQKLADKVNHEDLHQATEDDSWMVVNDGQQPRYPQTPLYPDDNAATKLGKVQSYYQQEQYLPWGVIHSVRLWWVFLQKDDTLLSNLNNMQSGSDFDAIEQKIPQAVRATKVAGALHPYFYYVPATFTTRYIPPPSAQNAKPSTEVDHVYLLVEAYTIEGWEQYSYKRVHEDKTYPDGSEVIRDYDAQNGSRLVVPDQYQRIRDYLNNLYGMDASDPQSDLMRLSVMETGTGFVNHEQHVAWLMASFNPETFVSSGMVPAELQGYFQEASQLFGIPVWFLNAVCERESSFDPTADNGESGDSDCFGLMQVNIDNWNEDAPQFGFNPALDKDNPRAQVIVGAFILKGYLGNVDWNSSDWQDQTLVGLTWYGGFRNAQNQVDQDAISRCDAEYASSIWNLAEGFRDHSGYYWPVTGPHIVTSPFNLTDPSERIHHGVDIAATMGEPVYSVSGGYVQEIGYGDPVYGNYVVVNDTTHTYKYAHFGNVAVRQNQPVEAGATVLGNVGMTGDTTGPHVHLEIVELSTGNFINPLDIIGYNCTIENQGGD
jgi:hypothetical protein